MPDTEVSPTQEPRTGDAFNAVLDREELEQGFRRLTVEQRVVIVLHFMLDMTLEQVAETLSVARSNVSTSLHELQGWGIVKVVHVMGDRRDHFESMKDVWEMFQIILDERKKRECDPTLVVLRELAAKAKKSGAKDAHTHERLADMLSFFETISTWYTQMRRMPTGSVIKFVKMSDKIRKVLGFTT